MKVTYLPGPATRSGEVVQILEMQDDEEGVLVQWGPHDYTFNVKWIDDSLAARDEGDTWSKVWTRKKIQNFNYPEQFRVRIT